jgi:hypothetical protein
MRRLRGLERAAFDLIRRVEKGEDAHHGADADR